MTRSNRLLNRLLLGVVGLIALALAAAVAWPSASAIPSLDGIVPAWPQRTVASLDLTDVALWAIAGAAVVLIVLALAWILSRGRGRTSTALRHDGIEIDTRLIEQLLDETLEREPDVVRVSASAFRVRRRRAVRVRVDARRGADLERLTTAVDQAVERLGETLGTELPILVHITSGLRASLSRENRAV